MNKLRSKKLWLTSFPLSNIIDHLSKQKIP
jgi:hypothetical protein